MPRSSWKGYLRLSLVTVQVEAVNAVSNEDDDVQMHQLHATCHNRIRYKKVCPVHGEVPNDEIVLGYEREKGEYVVVDKAEIDQLKDKSEKAISIDTFVVPEEIDPIWFEGRTYYLLPEGAVAQKPYAVLREAIATKNCWGIGQGFLWGRQRLVLIRAQGGAICMELLHFHAQLRDRASVPDDLHLPEVSKDELRLATRLIDATTESKFDLGKYEDSYAARLKELLASKAGEQESVVAPAEREQPVINLMDALRRSVEFTKRSTGKSRPAARGKREKPAARRGARHAS